MQYQRSPFLMLSFQAQARRSTYMLEQPMPLACSFVHIHNRDKCFISQSSLDPATAYPSAASSPDI